jgi:beta-ureidopropionase / N-carbamoyl-L-amino-acid hydrolase
MNVAAIPTINSDRLQDAIHQLASIGALPNGGVCRLAFSDEDLQARKLVEFWMMEAGMDIHIDVAGNIIGRYAGKSISPQWEPLLRVLILILLQ